MPRPRTNWDDTETKLLLDMCLQEKDKYNFNQFGVTRDGWNNIYPYFLHYDRKQVNNKLASLKTQYQKWKDGLSATGFCRDTQTGGIATDPEYRKTQDATQPDSDNNTQCAETSAAGAARCKPPRFLNELGALYGDRNCNMGSFMSAGGIGASTPPHVVWLQDHIGPSSYHSGSKRDTRDQVVNSPEKKACNVGEYMARLSESIAAMSTSRDRERTREQAEVNEAMPILRDDGVPVPSDMYFEALELFKNSVYRREFKNMENTGVRIAWLTWHMNRNKKTILFGGLRVRTSPGIYDATSKKEVTGSKEQQRMAGWRGFKLCNGLAAGV
ncbi:unnamed protein product [Miscanthus lutarioriparius]|uniref:Myb/SANT-like domain-containing protein n=1 Tax=Miscanthus lutarioriparius TaxID=422564 RepID=A0A811S0I3_9POAL|nr:unnamed protein product [Miscanthus lutarioriparius]